MADMARKGRGRGRSYVGEKNPSSKLTEVQVIEMRRLYGLSALSISAMSKLSGVSRAAVKLIVTGKKWNHLNNASPV